MRDRLQAATTGGKDACRPGQRKNAVWWGLFLVALATVDGFWTFYSPIMMTVLFYQFASGLVLYWMLSSVLAIGHQLWIGRKMQPIDRGSGKARDAKAA